MQGVYGRVLLLVLLGITGQPPVARGEEFVLHSFTHRQLTDVYYSEGAGAGDINRDGHVDVVYGPYWFAGPDFASKHEIYPAVPQPRQRYADNFFSWVRDFNRDDHSDVFVVGFPGTPAYVYENPGPDRLDQLWTRHQVFDWVSNESPHFTQLVGDERPELVCTRDGHFGYAAIDWERPFEPWTFHAVSEKIAAPRFGHGQGVGDVNGDGRLDVIHAQGWFEQPQQLTGGLWTQHKVSFSDSYGGAEMFAYDVDGDGDNDVITSMAAHDFGLAWYEQVREGTTVTFRKHLIMGDRPEQNRYGLVFSELHSVQLADIDGDGLKDIVTGKTYWSHHQQSPMWDAGAVVYWFRLVRSENGVDWVPYRAGDDCGIGRQLGIHDVNGDGLPDIVVGGMKGASVLIHQTQSVDRAAWQKAQPQPIVPPVRTEQSNPRSPIDAQTGRVGGALEGESLRVLRVTGGKTGTQKMGSFRSDRWSGAEQLFWTGAKPGDRLELELPVPAPGTYAVEMGLTMARDYGIVRITIDDVPLGEPLDLYHYPDVITTGVHRAGELKLEAGMHRLGFEIAGAHPSAIPKYLVGLDYVRLSALQP